MDFIIPQLPEEMENYLNQYDDLFTRPEMQEHFRYYVSGMISETHRKNIQRIMAKVVEGKYQSGHHSTQMSERGWFIQDDTGQEWGLRGKENPEGGNRLTGGTDGVARQYIGNVGKVSEGLVVVSSHYADVFKRLPITTGLYWPKASMEKLPASERTARRKRDKIQIAML